jgi:hypothetical protein
MSSRFDPYHKWLGISPKDQPPDHYRLLAIDRFESDPDVIASAADRQMAHVRSFQTGQHSDLSQQILNEISAARVCLLNAEKKEEYDRQLRQSVEPPVATPVTAARPLQVATNQPVQTSVSETQPELPDFNLRRKNRSWQVPITVVAVVVVLGLVLTFFVVNGTPPEDTPENTARNPTPQDAPTDRPTPPPPPEVEQLPEEPDTDPFEHKPTQPTADQVDGDEPQKSSYSEDAPNPNTADDPAETSDQPVQKTETVEEAAQRLREQFAGSKTEEDFSDAAQGLLVVSDRAIVQGNTDLAKELVTLALTAARRTDDAELKRTVTLRFIELQEPLEGIQKAAQERLSSKCKIE